jgi:hypothetical protein
MVRSSDRWIPFFSVPRWYDAVASPCHLFSRGHDHVAETSRADHYRAPCGHRRITPLVPTSVGWDDRCVSVEVYKEKPSRGVVITKSRLLSSSTVSPLLFPLRLVLANPPLAHLCHCSAHSPSKLFRRLRRQPLEEAQKKTERRTPACILDHASVRGYVRVPPLDACSDVPLHHRRSLSSFSFSCTHPSPASS